MKHDNMLDLTLDYHAHVLPGCDHGSDGIATSRRQLEMAADAGIRTICATPHFYPHRESAETFLGRREQAAAVLRANLPGNAPQIRLGAEVLICSGLDRMEGLERLCLEGSSELLLEMPFYTWTESVWDTLDQLCRHESVRIVLAHADRYPAENIEELIRQGVPLQLNVSCLMKPLRRKRYLAWIESGFVRYLGSDIHMLGSGYREWESCRKLLGKRHI